MKLDFGRIWTGTTRRVGPAARGSSWTGWSLWLDKVELEDFREILARRGEYPEAEALRLEILQAIDEAKP